MTSGTKVLLALIGLFVGILVLYYGFLMPSEPISGGLVRDPVLETPASDGAGSTDQTTARAAAARRASRLPAANTGTIDRGSAPGGVTIDQAAHSAGEAAGTVAGTGGARQRPERRSPAVSGPARGDRASRSVAAPTRKPARETSAAASTPASPGSTRGAAPVPPKYTPYVVREGDTMTSIAEAWFGDHNKWDLIAKANLVDPNRLKIGQVLRLPPRGARRAPLTGGPAAKTVIYTVRAGDSLSTIAKAYYGDVGLWQKIYAANRDRIGADAHAIEVGMKLRLPPK